MEPLIQLPKPSLTSLSVREAIALGARDIPTFGQIWFQRTLRQKSPQFHYDMSAVIQNPLHRQIGFMVFRDGAKTTLARITVAQRISYCISRTIMFVNISGTKAQHSLRWIKKQVEFNKPWAQAFGIRKGDKWSDEWCTIVNSQNETVNLVAQGITSGLRGLNIDDYRPDFIFCDDISDLENTATDEQRAKGREAFFAQLVRSLSPASESPLSQIVLAQTPINSHDLICQAAKDPTFAVFRHSCFSPDGQSAWPERRSTESLLKEKEGYIRRNQLSTWLAEMECTLVSGESQAFKRIWLRYWNVYPDEARFFVVLDPASSEEKKADFFAIVVMCVYQGKYYILDYSLARGMMPDMAWQKVLEYTETYRCRDIIIETVAYQKILAWYFRKQMQDTRTWFTIHEYRDRRRKDDRIVQAITTTAPYGGLLIREGMAEFEEVFELYGPGYEGKVDLIDAVAMGIAWYSEKGYGTADVEGEFRRLRDAEKDLDEIDDFQGAP
jgi:hypothetical protein